MRFSSRFLLFGGMFCSPVFAWAALPGKFSLWPLLLICMVPLFLWLGEAKSAKQAIIRGILAGIVIHTLQLYWIISVLMKFGGLPWFIAVPSLLLLSLYMALYLGIFSGCFFLFADKKTFLLMLVCLPAVWVGLDWLRSWLFGGFPWMDIGYGFWAIPFILQAADIFGHYGYTFLIVLVNLVFFTVLAGKFTLVQRLSGLAVAIILVGICGMYSFFRWETVSRDIENAERTVIGIVQGNVEQGRKWSPDEKAKTVDNYIELSERLKKDNDVSFVAWPETAMPFYLRNNVLASHVKAFTQRNMIPVLTGAPWYEIRNWDKKQIDYYNSAVLVGIEGTFDGIYHKSQLVPYGEYVPLKKYMPFLSPLVESVGSFTRGKVENPIRVDNSKVGVLICYESIFETISRAWVKSGANLLVNLTNDAWYGKSSAPYQSWAMTIYRSVETRRSLVRSANTGFSGGIDPLGRVGLRSELFVPWAGALSVPLMTGETFFVKVGWLFAPMCALAGFICVIAMFWFRRNNRT